MKVNKYKTGGLYYDAIRNRYDIKFSESEWYGGLVCGDCLDIELSNGTYISTRLAKAESWFLFGIDKSIRLEGLKVRIKVK